MTGVTSVGLEAAKHSQLPSFLVFILIFEYSSSKIKFESNKLFEYLST